MNELLDSIVSEADRFEISGRTQSEAGVGLTRKYVRGDVERDRVVAIANGDGVISEASTDFVVAILCNN